MITAMTDRPELPDEPSPISSFASLAFPPSPHAQTPYAPHDTDEYDSSIPIVLDEVELTLKGKTQAGYTMTLRIDHLMLGGPRAEEGCYAIILHRLKKGYHDSLPVNPRNDPLDSEPDPGFDIFFELRGKMAGDDQHRLYEIKVEE